MCVRRAQEARLQSLAMQLAESDCTLRVTNTHLCRKLISTWFLFPARISPQTHTSLAQATMLDRNTLRKCLDFVEGDYGFLLVNNLNDGRPRCRVNGWRAIRGLM